MTHFVTEGPEKIKWILVSQSEIDGPAALASPSHLKEMKNLSFPSCIPSTPPLRQNMHFDKIHILQGGSWKLRNIGLIKRKEATYDKEMKGLKST